MPHSPESLLASLQCTYSMSYPPLCPMKRSNDILTCSSNECFHAASVSHRAHTEPSDHLHAVHMFSTKAPIIGRLRLWNLMRSSARVPTRPYMVNSFRTWESRLQGIPAATKARH